MRIGIIALGSRGDVQPYIALGKGLKEAGHMVRLITHENFEIFVNSHGLEFFSVRGNVQELMESEEVRELLETGNFLKINSFTSKKFQDLGLDRVKDSLAGCQGIDLLLVGIGGLYLGISIAQKLGIPLLQAYLVPFSPTKAFPAVVFPQGLSKLGGYFNRFSHHLFRQIMWQGSRKVDNLTRQEVLELPPAPFLGPLNADFLDNYPVLYGFSPSAIAKPSDWDNNTYVTGYWFLDSTSDWTPPPELMEFLEAGSPPIYVGFGSMVNRNPEEMVDLVLQALEQTQQRAILLSGWGGLRKADLPDTVLMIDSIPHSWLFPRMAAVVHHGGAGTTAAGLRAGVPSIIISFFGDQPFWGKRIAELGVGPKSIPRKELTAEKLAQAIQQALTDKTIAQRAADLGRKIQAEDGIGNVVAIVKKIEQDLAVKNG